MTNSTTPAHQPTDDLPSAPQVDARPHLRTAIALAGSVVEAVRPDQLDLPTPCGAIGVADMRTHLLCGVQRVALVGREREPVFTPDFGTPAPAEGWERAWAAAAADVEAVWADDALLSQTVRVPWTALPGWAALTIYVNEITVHTWDLAVATGQTPAFDDDVVALSQASMEQAIPAEGRTELFDAVFAGLPPGVEVEYPFGPAVDAGPGASPIERLVAYNGRDPRA